MRSIVNEFVDSFGLLKREEVGDGEGAIRLYNVTFV